MNKFEQIIAGYEPVAVASVATAVFVLLAGLGIAVGDLPDKVNAVLAFLAVMAPMLSGWLARMRVTPTGKAK